MMSLLISVFDLTLEFSGPVPGDISEAKSMNHGSYASAFVLVANEFTVGISIFQPRCLGYFELGLIVCVQQRDQFAVRLIQFAVGRFVCVTGTLIHLKLRLGIWTRIVLRLLRGDRNARE